MKRILISLLITVLPMFMLGCSDDSGDGSAASAGADPTSTAETSDPLDKDALLNSLDDVRAMIVDADITANIEDVEYDAGTLTVTLSGLEDASDPAAMKNRCDDIGSAVALPDLRIVLQTPGGVIVAECTFSS
jgi:hypothetical protein